MGVTTWWPRPDPTLLWLVRSMSPAGPTPTWIWQLCCYAWLDGHVDTIAIHLARQDRTVVFDLHDTVELISGGNHPLVVAGRGRSIMREAEASAGQPCPDAAERGAGVWQATFRDGSRKGCVPRPIGRYGYGVMSRGSSTTGSQHVWDTTLKAMNSRPVEEPCAVAGCDRPEATYGWCSAHYTRWRVHGDVHADVPVRPIRSPDPCSVDGCDRDAKTRGWCQPHYDRVITFGDPLAYKPIGNYRAPPPPCSVPGCDRDAAVRGWCRGHYSRVLKHGDVRADLPLRRERAPGPPPPRTASNAVPDDLTPAQIEAARIKPRRRRS